MGKEWIFRKRKKSTKGVTILRKEKFSYKGGFGFFFNRERGLFERERTG